MSQRAAGRAAGFLREPAPRTTRGPSSATVSFLRESLAGAIGAAVHCVLPVALVQANLAGPASASTVRTVAGPIVNYAPNRTCTLAGFHPVNRAWTFRRQHGKAATGLPFCRSSCP